MPVPNARTQFGISVPGHRNPDLEEPDRFNLWERPGPIEDIGRTPGLMVVSRRGMVLAAGQIRRMWRQTVGYIPAAPPYSWTSSSPAPGMPGSESAPAFMVTRALRYMTRMVYMGQGIDNSRYAGLHTQIQPRIRSKPVTIAAGSVRGRPTVRNRMTSFGQRVPTLNQPVEGAETSE